MALQELIDPWDTLPVVPCESRERSQFSSTSSPGSLQPLISASALLSIMECLPCENQWERDKSKQTTVQSQALFGENTYSLGLTEPRTKKGPRMSSRFLFCSFLYWSRRKKAKGLVRTEENQMPPTPTPELQGLFLRTLFDDKVQGGTGQTLTAISTFCFIFLRHYPRRVSF